MAIALMERPLLLVEDVQILHQVIIPQSVEDITIVLMEYSQTLVLSQADAATVYLIFTIGITQSAEDIATLIVHIVHAAQL
jgi:hypothetical protein